MTAASAPMPATQIQRSPGRSWPPRLGLLGGGQLAKMLAQAASQLGCQVWIVEKDPDCPAAAVAARTWVAAWDDLPTLLEFARACDVVSLENEFVPVESLEAMEQQGCTVRPGSATFRRVRDKWTQKQTLAQAGLPVPTFAEGNGPEDVLAFARIHGWPVLLKARCHGYDGKGNATVRGPEELEPAWQRLGGHQGRRLFVETFCRFERELAVIVTRAANGQCVVYPVVETVQKNHVCHTVAAPATVDASVARQAADIARAAIECIDGVGSFGVELFLEPGGRLWINELAPRVHNSGHYTIEACECSQFENHVRAVLGWPLGSPRMRTPAAAMVNLLGRCQGPGQPIGLEKALAVPGAHVHIYGKTICAPGRKMGHVTALAETVEEALARAKQAAEAITFGEPTISCQG
jgi:5-(carboxyamino)imidazole ribonucleotide synthase